MENIDYSTWELADLIKAEQDIKKAIEERREREKEAMIEELKGKAETLGLPMFEIIKMLEGDKKPSSSKPPKAPVLPKFCNPDNKTETWAGRGRKPAWFVACIGKGMKEEDLLIEKQAS